MGELDLAPPDPDEAERAASETLATFAETTFRRRPRRTFVESAGWSILGLLLAAVFAGALTFDRERLPLLGDEATYALQASSLIHDFDLAYTRTDFERFVAAWGIEPDGLILQSRSAGEGGTGKLVYGKPPLYALATAPFVGLAPVRGGVIANALFLALAALLAARALRRTVGAAAPLWVAVFLFASLAFVQVFWGEADLFLLAATASGFALIYGDGEGEMTRRPASIYQGREGEVGGGPKRGRFRWLAAGALLAIPAIYRPVYAALWLPALLAAWRPSDGRRLRSSALLLFGGLLSVALSMGMQRAAGGDWTGYGGERQGLYGRAAAKAVDLETGTWTRSGKTASPTPAASSASWFRAGASAPHWDLSLLRWNVLYLLVGRSLGLLPYFLPLLLGFTAWGRDRGRWALPLAVLLALASFLVLRPFDMLGGGAYGDRYFLALYPALWFVAARPGRALPALLAAGCAAPFLWTLWLQPRLTPLGGEGGFRQVTPLARRILPYETTQQNLPGSEAADGGIWVKFLDSKAFATSQGRMRVVGDAQADLVLAAPQPLEALHVELGARAPSRLEAQGEILHPLMLRADGGVLFAVPLGRPVAVHPTWWSPYPYSFYRLRFRLPGAPNEPIGFRLRPAHALIEGVERR